MFLWMDVKSCEVMLFPLRLLDLSSGRDYDSADSADGARHHLPR